MFSHSTNTASFFSVLIAALIYSLSLAGVAAAQSNTSLGSGALVSNTTGNNNTAIGGNALFFNTTGSNNTATGLNSLLSNNIGTFNTAIGAVALASNTNGNYNTACGAFSLVQNTTGDYNTACGLNALFTNTTGSRNTAFGADSLLLNTTGFQNIATGTRALFSNTTGFQNVAYGADALLINTTGDRNIALGFAAGSSLTTGNDNIAIGHTGVPGVGNRIWLGTPGVHTTTLLTGNVGIGTTTPGVTLDVVGSTATPVGAYTWFGPGSTNLNQDTGGTVFPTIRAGGAGQILATFFLAISDERIKNTQGRSDSAADLRKLLDIEVTDFLYKDVVEKGSRPQKKVIAQQVEKVYPEAVSTTTDVVPDIYQKAPINNGWVELATDLKVSDRVRLITEKGHRTDFAADGDVVFVYGREVKDFRNVDYEAIAMLNVSATQELTRRLQKQTAAFMAQAEEMSKQITRIAELEQDRQAQATRIAELEKQASEIAMLKQQMAALQAAGLTAGGLDAAQLAAAR